MEGDKEKNQEDRRKNNNNKKKKAGAVNSQGPAQQSLFLAAFVEIILHMSVEEAVIVLPG